MYKCLLQLLTSIGCNNLVKKFYPIDSESPNSSDSTFLCKTGDGVSDFVPVPDFPL